MKKRLKRGLLLLIILPIVLILLTTGWLTATESGLNFLLQQAKIFSPYPIQIKKAHGTIISGLTLENIKISHPQLELQSQHFNIQFNIAALLHKTLHIKNIALNNSVVTLPPSETTTEASPPLTQLPDIQSPMDVNIDHLEINTLALHQAEQNYQLNKLILQANIDQQLTINQLTIELDKQETLPEIKAKLSGNILLTHPHTADLNLQWQTDIAPIGKAQGLLTLQGDSQALQLQHDLQPLAIKLNASIQQPLTQLTWKANIAAKSLSWPLQADHPDIRINRTNIKAQGDLNDIVATINSQLLEGSVQLTSHLKLVPEPHGTLQLFSNNLDLTELWPDWPTDLALEQQLTAKFTPKQLTIKNLSINLPPTAAKISMKGNIDLEKTELKQVKLQWDDLQWPLVGVAQVTSQQGQMQLSGTAEDYQLKINAQVMGHDIPSTRLNGQAQGDQQGLQQLELVAKLLDGHLKLTGETHWLPQPNWKLKITGKQLNPGKQWADWPGKLGLQLTSNGTMAKQLQTTINIKQLNGKLRQYPIQLTSQIEINDQDYQLKTLQFKSGSTQIQAQAQYNDQLTAQWRIKAPNLNTLHPEAKGSLTAQGNIAGTLEKPQITAHAKADKISYKAFQLATAQADIALDMQTDKINLKVHSDSITQDNKAILNKLILLIDGKLSNHKITSNITLPKQQLTLALTGAYDQLQTSWAGTLTTLTLALDKFDHWTLQQPSSLTLSPAKIQLAASCLQAQKVKSKICLDADWQPTHNSTLKLNVNALPVNLFTDPTVGKDIQVSGSQINANLLANVTPQGDINAKLAANLAKGQLTTEIEGKIQRFNHGGGQINATITEQGLQYNSKFLLLNDGTFESDIKLPNLNHIPLADAQPIAATITSHISGFSLLPRFVPQIHDASGHIDTLLKISGDLTQPKINADIKLNDAKFDMPEFGLLLERITAHLQADENGKATAQLKLHSGQGWLKINGQGQFKQANDWQGNVNIIGHELTAINTPDINALVSPHLKLTLSPTNININGKIHIPQADITPNIVVSEADGGGAATNLSSDAIIIDETITQPKPTKNPLKINGKIKLSLGDKVKLDVVGFSSQIAGGIDILLDEKSALPNALGELQIINGRYRSYNQELEIEKGRILFLGGAIDNPGLDIQAFRTIKQSSKGIGGIAVSKAGVHIRGRAQTPQISLFSVPPLAEDSAILSYLLLGTSVTGDNSTRALSLGKYLRPNLYVSFAFDIFEKEKAFNSRYDINRKLGVETVIGDRDSGVNFTYRISR